MTFFKTKNPFKRPEAFYYKYAVYSNSQGRDANSASITEETFKGYIYADEPQRVSRVTTNLMAIGDEAAMQQSAYEIITDETTVTIEKGDTIKDIETGKHYLVVSSESVLRFGSTKSWNLMVTEYDD